MKNTMLTIVLGLFIASGVVAQEPGDTLWTRTYGGPGVEVGSCVQQTVDDGFILVGITDYFGAGGTDFYVVKTDANGDTIWTRTYGGSANEEGYSIQQTNDGGYIVAGYTKSYGAGDKDVYLVRTDANGDTIWTNTYGGASSYDWGLSVQQTADGGFIVAGYTGPVSGGIDDVDMYVVRTEANGDTLWTRTYGGMLNDEARSIQETDDGGFIIAGRTSSFGAGGSSDVYLVKTDSAGDTLWTEMYGGDFADGGNSVQQTADGGYIIAGLANPPGATGFEFYLIKTESNGDTLWTRVYGGVENDVAYSVKQTSDGGFILAGDTDSFGPSMISSFYVVKTDADGDTIWTRAYGRGMLDKAMSVDITSDGSYAIAGYSADPTFNIDIWLLKVAGEQIIGDFNSDGYVDAADLQLFGDHWHFDENSPGWDPLYNLSPTPDPTSGLQIIDAADLQVFGDHWHEGTPPKSGQGGKNGKGPNENAGIVFDLDATTYGNQNLTSIPSQPGGTYIQVDVYCTDVQNLDTYEFEVIYDPTELAYVTATPTNPITYEPNILTSNGGEALGWMIDTSTPGVLSIAYTLAGTDPAQAPEGEGLIADIVFQALVATHGTLTFGDVYFYDSYGVVDLITDTGTATLPVELAAFTATYVAENGYTSIYWATASETDVNGFNVYRNTDDDFGTAMRINYDLIPGYGTTSEPKEYTFIDDNPVVFDITYYYWLESIDFGGETHVYASISLTPEEGEGGYVNDFKENRLGNHPNPFKGSTTIEYAIKGRLKAEPVEIRIYNVAGQLIETIEARYGTAKWNVDNLPTGVYFYQLKTENYNEVKKMLLIR